MADPVTATAALSTAGTAAATTTAAGVGAASLLPGFTAANVLAGLSVASMIRQGQAAKVTGRVQADQIKQDAKNKEVNRRRRLVSSLASQNATRAASGIAFLEGSSKEAALEDIRTGRGAGLVETGGAEAAAASAISQAGYRRTGSMIGATASLLDQINRNVDRG